MASFQNGTPQMFYNRCRWCSRVMTDGRLDEVKVRQGKEVPPVERIECIGPVHSMAVD
jgi:hypothetical protein